MRGRWQRGADAVGVGLYTILFLVFLLQITARFVFNKPLPWTDELAVILYVWVILWTAALVVPRREHVAFDLLWNMLGPGGRRACAVAGHLLLVVTMAWALPGTWDYVHFMAREGTPVLGVPFMVVFLPFVLLMVVTLVQSGLALARALRGDAVDDGPAQSLS